MSYVISNYRCKHCGYEFPTFQVPKKDDICPKCGVVFIGTEIIKEKWNPGTGTAVIFLILAILIPVIPSFISLLIALKTKVRKAKIVAWLGVTIGILWLVVLSNAFKG
ncbi:hypothetical protein KJ742_02030 [Patescibacteria group bacterium]|nr:hypothetical protein [Patescibacteria group bacterium]